MPCGGCSALHGMKPNERKQTIHSEFERVYAKNTFYLILSEKSVL